MLPCVIKMCFIIEHAILHTQVIFFLLSNNVNFISNNSICNNKHTCISMTFLSKTEKRMVEMFNNQFFFIARSDYFLPNTKRQMKRLE
jgi:hypothetical protein